MNDKNIISQLHSLRVIKPDAAWSQANRQVLREQIYSGSEASSPLSLWLKTNLFMHQLARPYAVAIMIIVFFSGSAVTAELASRSAQPGDTLYIAKTLSEQAQYSLTFSPQAKTQLNLQFAKQRVDEISQILDSNDQPADKDQKVAALKSDFKKEISQAKSRLAPSVKVSAPTPTASDNQTDKTDKTNQDSELYAAGANKSKQRIDISIPRPAKSSVKAPTVAATSTPQANNSDPHSILEKSEWLLDQADYKGAKQALDQAGQLLDQPPDSAPAATDQGVGNESK